MGHGNKSAMKVGACLTSSVPCMYYFYRTMHALAFIKSAGSGSSVSAFACFRTTLIGVIQMLAQVKSEHTFKRLVGNVFTEGYIGT